MTSTSTLETGTGFIRYDRLYIGGDWVAPATGATIDVVSPSTEDGIGQVPEAAFADADLAVTAARRASDDQTGWSRWTPERRGEAMERLAKALESRGADMA